MVVVPKYVKMEAVPVNLEWIDILCTEYGPVWIVCSVHTHEFFSQFRHWHWQWHHPLQTEKPYSAGTLLGREWFEQRPWMASGRRPWTEMMMVTGLEPACPVGQHNPTRLFGLSSVAAISWVLTYIPCPCPLPPPHLRSWGVPVAAAEDPSQTFRFQVMKGGQDEDIGWVEGSQDMLWICLPEHPSQASFHFDLGSCWLESVPSLDSNLVCCYSPSNPCGFAQAILFI